MEAKASVSLCWSQEGMTGRVKTRPERALIKCFVQKWDQPELRGQGWSRPSLYLTSSAQLKIDILVLVLFSEQLTVSQCFIPPEADLHHLDLT